MFACLHKISAARCARRLSLSHSRATICATHGGSGSGTSRFVPLAHLHATRTEAAEAHAVGGRRNLEHFDRFFSRRCRARRRSSQYARSVCPGAKARTKLAEKLAASEASAADLAQQAENAKIRAEGAEQQCGVGRCEEGRQCGGAGGRGAHGDVSPHVLGVVLDLCRDGGGAGLGSGAVEGGAR